VVGGLALAAIAIAALVIVARRPHGGARPSAPAPVVAIDPVTAYDSVRVLIGRGAAVQSVPYFESTLASRTNDPRLWEIHYNFGAALHNGTVQLDQRRGVPIAATRSSLDRAALCNRALSEYAIALATAPRDVDRAFILYQFGSSTQIWGLPWETLIAFREASAADPSRANFATRYAAYLKWMQNPSLAPPERVSGVAPPLP
jgi:hypothetical protein